MGAVLVLRFTDRRVADRFDRPLLLHYLAQLGIPVDDDLTGRAAQLVQQQLPAGSAPRTVSLHEARAWVSG